MFPIWIAEPLQDHQRVSRPVGNGSFSINIEPFRGVQTSINFLSKTKEHAGIDRLNDVLRREEPRLLGLVDCPELLVRRRIQDAQSLVNWWCQYLSTASTQGEMLESAIEGLLTELDTLLDTERITAETITPLAGLTPPNEWDKLEIENGFQLRRLTPDEITDLGRADVYYPSEADVSSRFVHTALVATSEVTCRLVVGAAEGPMDSDRLQSIQEKANLFLASLSVLKSGQVSSVSTQTRLRPTLLPGMSGPKMQPLSRSPFEFMELTGDDLQRLRGIYSDLSRSPLSELRIAASRLNEAERRLSQTDSLLDAVIGLETLLNPQDYGELAFRVAVNYAFLAPANERRLRYDRLKEVQKARNGIVHGGKTTQNVLQIHSHASTARQCLRDTITRFLSDETLKSASKLDADFWLDRIIPPQ